MKALLLFILFFLGYGLLFGLIGSIPGIRFIFSIIPGALFTITAAILAIVSTCKVK